MFKERVERLFPFIKNKGAEALEEPEDWPLVGDVPGHGLVTISRENQTVRTRLENGELEKVGEVSVYITGPESHLVVKRTAVAVGVVAASAAAGLGIYKTIEYFLKRRRERPHSK